MNIAVEKIIKFDYVKGRPSKNFGWFPKRNIFKIFTKPEGIYWLDGDGKPYRYVGTFEDFANKNYELINNVLYEKPCIKVWFDDNNYPDVYYFENDDEMLAMVRNLQINGIFLTVNEG